MLPLQGNPGQGTKISHAAGWGRKKQLVKNSYVIILLFIVQSLSHVQVFVTPWTTARQASLSFTMSQSLLKLVPSNHLTLCCPLLLLSSVFPSIRVFSSEWALHIMWPEYWSLSFSISSSNDYSGLISFRIDWFDLFAVQGTLYKSFCWEWEFRIIIA